WPNWNYEPGEWVRVVCYTNAAQAQLVLNGKNVGKPKPYDAEHGIIYWDVPFEPGVLEVLGLNEDGKTIAEYAVETAGVPAAIEVLQVDQSTFEGSGVVQLNLRLIDKNGVVVPDAANEIVCEINGPGVFLGLEAGNNRDMG